MEFGTPASHADGKVDSRSAYRSLDHFVTVANDLEVAFHAYRRLGFRPMQIMEHVELGTSNIIVQFLDTYLEVIGDFHTCKVASLRDKMQPWLKHADMYWMTSLTSSCLDDDRSVVVAAGLAPDPIVSARRRVRLLGGGWDETDSRSMYVWNLPNILTSLFISDHRKPEAIWIPAYQRHPNGASRVLGIRYVNQDPFADEAYLNGMFGGGGTRSDNGLTFRTPRGETFEVLSPEAYRNRVPYGRALEPGVAGRGADLVLATESMDRCHAALRDGGIPCDVSDDAIYVEAAHCAGVGIEFRSA